MILNIINYPNGVKDFVAGEDRRQLRQLPYGSEVVTVNVPESDYLKIIDRTSDASERVLSEHFEKNKK